MKKSTKAVLAVTITLVSLISVLPEQGNYYETAINLVADNYAVPADELHMLSGSYQNFMLFKTVEVKLRTAQSKTIRAVMKQTPFSDWSLNTYTEIDE
ncbi:MAG: hypothetical protein DWP95_07700 [Proteobacteria bacterium]|nr:MAG: hypothetical protein DWP95_07700 [Pseudomonadota bacterium]